ncbi:MAG: hypothetical protein WBA92_05495, partial [Pseudorhodobacter sp.]
SKTRTFVKSAVVLSFLAAFPAASEAQSADRQKAQLARTAQIELSRLGCYKMKVDGQWGLGSRRALATYYSAKRSSNGNQEPTPQLIGQLGKERRAVCTSNVGRVAALSPSANRPKVDVARAAKSRLNQPNVSNGIRIRLLKSLLNPGSF